MAISDAMPLRTRRYHRAVPCLLLCAGLLGPFDALHQLSFVQGVAWDGTRAAQRQVAQRFNGQREPTRGEPDADGKVEEKRLTSNIKKAYSAEKLIEVLDGAVDGPIFNFYHASAAYTKLQKLKRKRDNLQAKDWKSPVLLRLHTRVEDMVMQDQLNAQASANILWSIARLSARFKVPTQLLAALVKSVPSKVTVMDEQHLSNSLWACAKLKEIAADVLEAVPAVVAQMKIMAKEMNEQALSNSLWASAQLKDVAPDVLKVVPAIVDQIPGKAQDMIPQHLSNCLWASAQLKDEVPEVLEILPVIVEKILSQINEMAPQGLANSLESLVLLQDSVPEVAGFLPAGGSMDEILKAAAKRLNTVPQFRRDDLNMALSMVLWACAKAEVYDGELLDSVAQHLGSRTKLSSVPGFNLCALSWSYEVLDTGDDFEDFKRLLMSETAKRGFNEADVESCERGRFRWNQAS